MDLSSIKPSKSRRNDSKKPKKRISISKDTLKAKRPVFKSLNADNILRPTTDHNRLYKPTKSTSPDSTSSFKYKQIKDKKRNSEVTVISSSSLLPDSDNKGFLTSQVSSHVTKKNSWCHAHQFTFTTNDLTDCLPATNISVINSHSAIATINNQRILLVVPRHYEPCGAIARLKKNKEPHMVRLFDKEDTISLRENVDIYFRWKVWCN
ncbi:BA75_04200T0 [Komagataella pastoris]|uniref:BA75_04200T0 n=1 Tax=Komagataella pastoris TaxID=4922 RepID=A0A1B2JGA8_PICPA|nr:BA75_04200T0 [Komagataella pastoris]